MAGNGSECATGKSCVRSGASSANSRTSPRPDPGQKPAREKLPDLEPRPLPRARGLRRGSGRPPRRRSRPPRASGTRDLPALGPAPRGCASRKLPTPRGSLPASAPPPSSLSGARLAWPCHHSQDVSPPPFPTARRPAVVLVLAGPRQRAPRYPARSHSPAGRRAQPAARCARLRHCRDAHSPPLGKPRQLVQHRDGERAKVTSPPPTPRPSCPEVRGCLPQVPARGPVPGVRGTLRLLGPENFTPSSKSGLRGRCPATDSRLRAEGAVLAAGTAVGGS